MLNAEEAERLAEHVLTSHFPDADAGLAAGSIVRGEGGEFSDLDMVVLYAHLQNARRESFIVDGVSVETFVHDSETLRWTLEADREAGKPAHIQMVSEARIVGPRPTEAREWKDRALAMLRIGPPPLTADQINLLRYHITVRIDDLRDARTHEELVATATWLYAPLADLLLRGRGAWAATAKWIPRSLKALDPALAAEFSAAFDILFTRRDPGPLLRVADLALAPFGGSLFDGYTSQSEPPARSPAS